jgi:hypothetical protein
MITRRQLSVNKTGSMNTPKNIFPFINTRFQFVNMFLPDFCLFQSVAHKQLINLSTAFLVLNSTGVAFN